MSVFSFKFVRNNFLSVLFFVSMCINGFTAGLAGVNRSSVPLVPLESIPDSASLRKTIAQVWLLDSCENIAALKPESFVDDNGNHFNVRAMTLKEENMLEIVISPVGTDFSGEKSGKIPQGTWTLYKNLETGQSEAIKIYPRENPELYLTFRPCCTKKPGHSYVDICLFNAYVRCNVDLGIPFENLYYFSLMELKNVTKKILPWDVFNPPVLYSSVESASDIVRERLYRLVFIEDGGFDEYGRPIYLSSGMSQNPNEIIAAVKPEQNTKDVIGGVNCSGFAKWVVDGIIRPKAGQGIFVKPLTTKTAVPDNNFTRPHEINDIFFGLDWIRNLAAAALSLNVKRTIHPIGSGVDVKIEPFALVKPASKKEAKEDKKTFKGYIHNAGYQTNYLQALLYYLAITEPGHFYLGAVNRDSGSPPIRSYNHTAVFFPYFDILGCFHIDVYESGRETSISEFMNMNNDAYTALVRIRAPEIGLFNP